MRQTRNIGQPVALTLPECHSLLKAAERLSTRHYFVVCFMLTTGCRAIELSRAKIEDFTAVEGGGALWSYQGKGKKTKCQIRDIAPALFELVLAATEGKQTGCLIPGYSGECISTRRLQQYVRESFIESDLGDKHVPHDLRNTAAVIAINAGLTVEQVQNLLGHANEATTRHYIRDAIRDEIIRTGATTVIADRLSKSASAIENAAVAAAKRHWFDIFKLIATWIIKNWTKK